MVKINLKHPFLCLSCRLCVWINPEVMKIDEKLPNCLIYFICNSDNHSKSWINNEKLFYYFYFYLNTDKLWIILALWGVHWTDTNGWRGKGNGRKRWLGSSLGCFLMALFSNFELGMHRFVLPDITHSDFFGDFWKSSSLPTEPLFFLANC